MMKRFFIIIFALSAIVGCDAIKQHILGGSEDWLLFRGDNSLSGYTREKLPDNLKLLWSHKSGVRTVSSPVIMGGTTYWCDVKGKVRGVDHNGNAAFEYDMQTPVEATPMLHDSVLYIGRIDGALAAISLSKRDTLWCYRTEGQISASPNVVDFGREKALVVGSYDNYMYCIDLRSGALQSKFESGYYINGAVATHKRHAIFGSCDAWLRIVDCQEGKVTDSLQLDGYIPASPAIAEENIYIGDYSGNIYEIRTDKGRIYDYRTLLAAEENSGALVSVPAVTPDVLYITSSDKYLFAIDRTTGKELWRYLLKGNIGESSPVVADDKVVICSRTGVVSIVDAASGELRWEHDAGEQIVASPAVVGGRLYVLTAKGTLLCFGEKED